MEILISQKQEGSIHIHVTHSYWCVGGSSIFQLVATNIFQSLILKPRWKRKSPSCHCQLAGCSSPCVSVCRRQAAAAIQRTEHQMAQVVLILMCLQKSMKEASPSSSTVVENQWVCLTFNCQRRTICLQQSKSVTSKSHLINDLQPAFHSNQQTRRICQIYSDVKIIWENLNFIDLLI